MAFCGDGLNDLAALVTAEVGLAIGPLDAMVAAPVSTRRSSIAGSAPLHIAEVASSRTPQFVVHMAVCLAVYASDVLGIPDILELDQEATCCA